MTNYAMAQQPKIFFFVLTEQKIIEEHENRRIERKASSLSSKWASVKKARVARDKRKGISTLGRIAGKVAPSQTTLSRAIGPLPKGRW